MSSHVAKVTQDIEAAKQRYAPAATTWTAESLAYHIQIVLQGCFVLAKAKQDVSVARESLAHLQRYLEALFIQPKEGKRKEKP